MIYTNKMCEAILVGAHRQMRLDGYAREGEVGTNVIMDDGDDEVKAASREAHNDGSTVGSPPRADDGRRPAGEDDDAQWHSGEPKPTARKT